MLYSRLLPSRIVSDAIMREKLQIYNYGVGQHATRYVIDFIGNKISKFSYPQITWIFADVFLEN